ncbi:hypothetical protein BC833DRAFT_660277 [Globomyces pollinis-pini]|nr:hypothetical protein BC833DRAFT_660277 [Globomyces pollinis-pini]
MYLSSSLSFILKLVLSSLNSSKFCKNIFHLISCLSKSLLLVKKVFQSNSLWSYSCCILRQLKQKQFERDEILSLIDSEELEENILSEIAPKNSIEKEFRIGDDNTISSANIGADDKVVFPGRFYKLSI